MSTVHFTVDIQINIVYNSVGRIIKGKEMSAGKVVSIEGNASVVHGGVQSPVQEGMHVNKNDFIVTGGNARMTVEFEDGSILTMGPSSELIIDEMVYDESAQEGTLGLTMDSGVFAFVSGMIAKTDPDAMVLKTPVATIGIRGTEGVIDLREEDLKVLLVREQDGFVGEMVVMSGNGMIEVINEADKFVMVTKNGFVTPPMTMDYTNEDYDGMLGDIEKFLDSKIHEFETEAGGEAPAFITVASELKEFVNEEPITDYRGVTDYVAAPTIVSSRTSPGTDDEPERQSVVTSEDEVSRTHQEPEPLPEHEPEPTPAPGPVQETDPDPEPTPDPVPDETPEPTPSPEPDEEPDPEPVPEPDPEVEEDHDRGHGNDPDGFDDDNPGKKKFNEDDIVSEPVYDIFDELGIEDPDVNDDGDYNFTLPFDPELNPRGEPELKDKGPKDDHPGRGYQSSEDGEALTIIPDEY